MTPNQNSNHSTSISIFNTPSPSKLSRNHAGSWSFHLEPIMTASLTSEPVNHPEKGFFQRCDDTLVPTPSAGVHLHTAGFRVALDHIVAPMPEIDQIVYDLLHIIFQSPVLNGIRYVPRFIFAAISLIPPSRVKARGR